MRSKRIHAPRISTGSKCRREADVHYLLGTTPFRCWWTYWGTPGPTASSPRHRPLKRDQRVQWEFRSPHVATRGLTAHPRFHPCSCWTCRRMTGVPCLQCSLSSRNAPTAPTKCSLHATNWPSTSSKTQLITFVLSVATFANKKRSLDCDCLNRSWLAALLAKKSVKMLTPWRLHFCTALLMHGIACMEVHYWFCGRSWSFWIVGACRTSSCDWHLLLWACFVRIHVCVYFIKGLTKSLTSIGVSSMGKA